MQTFLRALPNPGSLQLFRAEQSNARHKFSGLMENPDRRVSMYKGKRQGWRTRQGWVRCEDGVGLGERGFVKGMRLGPLFPGLITSRGFKSCPFEQAQPLSTPASIWSIWPKSCASGFCNGRSLKRSSPFRI